METTTPNVTYQHFYYLDIAGCKATCKICLLKLEYHQRSGTNSLKRHLRYKHPKAALAKDRSKAAVSSSQPTLDQFQCSSSSVQTNISTSAMTHTTRCALMVACANHVIPFSFFEDRVITMSLQLPTVSRQNIHQEIRVLGVKLRLSVFETHRGQWASLVLDGWKNPSTDHHHVTILMFLLTLPEKPIYIKSYVLQRTTADEIRCCIADTYQILQQYDITPVAIVTDNARSMLKAAEDAFKSNPHAIPLRCGAHIVNLFIRDAFRDVPFIARCFTVLKSYIEIGEIRRYCETRWLSVFDRLTDLSHLLAARETEHEQRLCEQVDSVIAALKPFVKVLNTAQSDGSGWNDVYQGFAASITQSYDKGLQNVAAVAERRLPLLCNEVVKLQLFMNGSVLLDELSEGRISSWLKALKINEFADYLADREFHGVTAPVPRRLRIFMEHKLPKIAVSEAAVERCFSRHKIIHSKYRASLTDDVVNDILFIRYNVSWMFPDYNNDISEDQENDLLALHSFDE